MFILHFSPITGVVGLTKEFHRDKVKPTGVMIVLKKCYELHALSLQDSNHHCDDMGGSCVCVGKSKCPMVAVGGHRSVGCRSATGTVCSNLHSVV